jgi:hypothetical protein
MNAKVLVQLLGQHCIGREYYYEEGSFSCYVRIESLSPDLEFSPVVGIAEYLQPNHYELYSEWECEYDAIKIYDHATLTPAHYSTKFDLWCISAPNPAGVHPEQRHVIANLPA